MKKVIGLLLVSTLALTACGEKEKPKKKKIKSRKHKSTKIVKQKIIKKNRKKLKIKIHLLIAYKTMQPIKAKHKTINLVIIQTCLITHLQI